VPGGWNVGDSSADVADDPRDSKSHERRADDRAYRTHGAAADEHELANEEWNETKRVEEVDTQPETATAPEGEEQRSARSHVREQPDKAKPDQERCERDPLHTATRHRGQ
jgi:hypothetical protein